MDDLNPPAISGSDAVSYHRPPGWFMRNVFNRAVRGITAAGVSVVGSRIIEVRGRKSGQVRTTVVNVLDYEGHKYLVAPRGETAWVRNLRADDGRLTVRLGRRRSEKRAVEREGLAKLGVLRAYLRKWKFEVGVFFEGVGPDSSHAELAAVAGKHPVFRLN